MPEPGRKRRLPRVLVENGPKRRKIHNNVEADSGMQDAMPDGPISLHKWADLYFKGTPLKPLPELPKAEDKLPDVMYFPDQGGD